MGCSTTFLVYFKVIHFTCIIFVSNNCFQDHRIVKSVTDRLIVIFCILVTSGITYLISVASQIKDIVLFNNFNPISTGLFCLVVALGGGGVFHPLP